VEGVVFNGPDYRETVETPQGTLHLPSYYRIGKLIHEARHSEFPDGFGEAAVSLVRKASRMRSFIKIPRQLSAGTFMQNAGPKMKIERNSMHVMIYHGVLIPSKPFSSEE
jgi:hypothetical protein